VGVQEVRWEGGGTEPAGEHTFFYGKGNESHEMGTDFFVNKRIISAAEGWVLRDCFSYIIILNVHAPTEDKIDHVSDSFNDELDRVFNTFPK
jgi:hypothetical protein